MLTFIQKDRYIFNKPRHVELFPEKLRFTDPILISFLECITIPSGTKVDDLSMVSTGSAVRLMTWDF